MNASIHTSHIFLTQQGVLSSHPAPLKGLRAGARNLSEAVADGATGLITSPLDGARRDGVKGAIVGVAQGVVGVALKPASGVLDLAAKSTESMRHASVSPMDGMIHSGEATGRARARPPRAFGPDAILQVRGGWKMGAEVLGGTSCRCLQV